MVLPSPGAGEAISTVRSVAIDVVRSGGGPGSGRRPRPLAGGSGLLCARRWRIATARCFWGRCPAWGRPDRSHPAPLGFLDPAVEALQARRRCREAEQEAHDRGPGPVFVLEPFGEEGLVGTVASSDDLRVVVAQSSQKAQRVRAVLEIQAVRSQTSGPGRVRASWLSTRASADLKKWRLAALLLFDDLSGVGVGDSRRLGRERSRWLRRLRCSIPPRPPTLRLALTFSAGQPMSPAGVAVLSQPRRRVLTSSMIAVLLGERTAIAAADV